MDEALGMTRLGQALSAERSAASAAPSCLRTQSGQATGQDSSGLLGQAGGSRVSVQGLHGSLHGSFLVVWWLSGQPDGPQRSVGGLASLKDMSIPTLGIYDMGNEWPYQ